MKLDSLEYKVFRQFKEFPKRKFLLAISGGMDSVVLAHIFSRIQQKQKIELGIVHIHHGAAADTKQAVYREKTTSFVKKLSRQLKIKFHERKNQGRRLISEADLRGFRYRAINDVFVKNHYDFVVLAHHWEDLLETRIMRLMRGTGPQGLVAMKTRSENIFRPLLGIRRGELKTYAEKWKLEWVEDPSNRDLGPLRNWVRHELLTSMESKRPGSVMALSRSLENLAAFVAAHGEPKISMITHLGIDRDQWIELPVEQKQHVMASYMRTKGVANYSRTQINEIIKRLNTRRKSFAFRVSKYQWTVSQKHILCAG